MQRLLNTLISISCLTAAFGCSSSDPVNLGENASVIGERLGDYAATWEGYTEAFSFDSGSDRVRLVLDANGHGSIVFGADAPPAPSPTNPDVGPGFTTGTDTPPLVREGFAFSVYAVGVSERRLRFGARFNEPYRPWCEIQPSYGYETPALFHQCAPVGELTVLKNNGVAECSVTEFETDSVVALDCEKMTLCNAYPPICACDANGCTVPGDGPLDELQLQLDGALAEAGNELVGTLLIKEESAERRVTVRFTRE